MISIILIIIQYCVIDKIIIRFKTNAFVCERGLEKDRPTTVQENDGGTPTAEKIGKNGPTFTIQRPPR